MPKAPQLLSHTGAGLQSVKLDHDDFTKGASTSNTFGDAGFSPDSYNINLINLVGEITPTAAPGADVAYPYFTKGIVATYPGSYFGGVNNIFGMTAYGEFVYRGKTFGGAWTTSGAIDTTHAYTKDFSDICFYNGTTYATSHYDGVTGVNEDMSTWAGNGTSSIVTGWFKTNFGVYFQQGKPHPLLVFNGYLYIADGAFLWKWDGASSYIKVLTLESYSAITALAIDPNSGRMMVAYTTQVGSTSNTALTVAPAISKIGLYDGTNPTQFVKLVIMDDVVRSMYSVGGTVYVGYGTSLGVWNGAGVTFLRQLNNVVTKQLITNVGNDIYFCDGNTVWCYTEMQGLGKKVFYKIYKVPTGEVLQFICNIDGVSMINFGTKDGSANNRAYTLKVNVAGDYTQTAVFKSNAFHFMKPMYIRAVDIIMGALLGANETITPVI